jgi:hypothetical protein
LSSPVLFTVMGVVMLLASGAVLKVEQVGFVITRDDSKPRVSGGQPKSAVRRDVVAGIPHQQPARIIARRVGLLVQVGVSGKPSVSV